MVEHDFHETPNMYPNLSANTSNEQQFRLNKINVIKYYFIGEIKEREQMRKSLSKCIASFEYFDKSSVLSVTVGSICIASFVTVTGIPVGIMETNCGLAFPLTTGFVKKLLKKKNTIKLLR